MFALTFEGVTFVDVDDAALTLGGMPLTTLGSLLLLSIEISFRMTLLYCYFVAAILRTLPGMNSTRSVAVLTVRSASEVDGVAQCDGYNFPAGWLKQQV